MTSSTLEYTREAVQKAVSTGRSRDRNTASLVFLVLLWFSLFFGVMVLLVLIVDTVIEGAPRFDSALITRYDSTLFPERTGFRAGILGTLWLMVTTAIDGGAARHRRCALPRGVRRQQPVVQPADRGQPPEPRRRAVHRLRTARGGGDGAARLRAQGRRPGRCDRPGAADPAGHHHHHPRGGARGSQRDPVRLTGPGCHPVADDVAADAPLVRSPASRPARSSACRAPSARPRPAAARHRRSRPVRPDRRAQPDHGAADPDLLDDLAVPGGLPARRPPRPSSYCS